MKLFNFSFPYKKYIVEDEETKEEKICYRPMLPCSVEWAGKKSPLTDGLLDSGADGVVLPLGLAEFLNLDLNSANKKPMHVVGRKIERYVTKVNLIVGRGGRLVTIPDVTVSIPTEEDNNTPVILGRNPIFELYNITFIETEKKFTMKAYKKQ